jgi:hypothetical protein
MNATLNATIGAEMLDAHSLFASERGRERERERTVAKSGLASKVSIYGG